MEIHFEYKLPSVFLKLNSERKTKNFEFIFLIL